MRREEGAQQGEGTGDGTSRRALIFYPGSIYAWFQE
jgi:hypothetical protein